MPISLPSAMETPSSASNCDSLMRCSQSSDTEQCE
jgi:hypothetical protein